MVRSHKTIKWLLPILLLLLIGVATVAALELTNTTHLFHKAKASTTINYKPATESDKADSESHKQAPPAIVDQGSSTPSNFTTGLKTVQPVITTWGQDSNSVNVNGYVSGVVEEGGTCTLKLVRGTKVVTAKHTGEANASNTTCGSISIPTSSLTSGTWTATISYISSTSTGTSNPETISVN